MSTTISKAFLEDCCYSFQSRRIGKTHWAMLHAIDLANKGKDVHFYVAVSLQINPIKSKIRQLCPEHYDRIKVLVFRPMTAAGHDHPSVVDHYTYEHKMELLIASLESKAASIEQLKTLLAVAKCPTCDGSGAYPVDDGYGDCEAEQCQWCDEYKQIFGKYPKDIKCQ